MTLDEIRTLIMNSDREDDWHDVVVGSYFKDVPDVDKDTFEWHDSLIVYRDNVDLTIQWGMRSRRLSHVTKAEDLFHDRAHFPDPEATTIHADIFWAGSLIDRVELVYVDGGRGLLPVGAEKALNFDLKAPRPQNIEWEISATRFELAIARLLDSGDDVDEFANRIGMIVKD